MLLRLRLSSDEPAQLSAVRGVAAVGLAENLTGHTAANLRLGVVVGRTVLDTLIPQDFLGVAPSEGVVRN